MPYTQQPDPQAKSQGSLAFSKAGVDTGELVIRGGTHYEFSFLPTPLFGATRRGIDLSAWYTTAWMDRYVEGGVARPPALRRLLTTRWRHDVAEKRADNHGDGNVFSTYYRSRLDLGHSGSGGPRVRCRDMRHGCGALVAHDGYGKRYS